jgi:V8-like Glu-specific endopeptidase
MESGFGSAYLGGDRMTRRNWVAAFRGAAATFDWAAVAELSTDYVDHLYRVPTLPSSVPAVLLILLQNRRYEEVEEVADAALALGLDVPAVRRQYAQALVDGRNPAIALRLYHELADDESVPEADRIEARGGIGRCYKELFLACGHTQRRRDYLRRALNAYLEAYREDQRRTWHGINAVALLARADREHIDVTPQVNSEDLAADILQTVDGLPIPDMWTDVTACEALIGLHRYQDAVERAEAFQKTSPRAFIIASFLRQLRAVWQLDTTSPPGNDLLPVLRSALLNRDGGRVIVEPSDVRASRLHDLSDGHLEKVLGADRYQSLTWYRSGLIRCRAVARIQTQNDVGIGTGFLVAGADLHPDLPRLVLVTNGHVVPEAVRPEEALVVFHGLDGDPGQHNRFQVTWQCWYQPSQPPGLDTTILELDGYPADVEPIPLARALPRKPLINRRAYVIGHPRGLDQPQFSLQDTLLLDYDNRVLHYRAPTEGGSSGSPVFDDHWQLIGLHHAGGYTVLQLNNAGGTYAANEGIAITAIQHRLASTPITELLRADDGIARPQ